MLEGIVNFSDWEKIDLRVAQILEVEEIEGADKLWKLTVDIGDEIGKRVICAGIKEHYSKEELKDKKIIVFTNLAPRKMKGIESQGMLLAAVKESSESTASPTTTPKEEVVLLSPEKDIDVGSRVR